MKSLNRIFPVGVLLAALRLAQAAPEVVVVTLDTNTVQRIAVSVDRVTTLSFPAEITGLEGAFISQQPTLTTRFLLSYRPGSRYFSVCALVPHATANLNVVLGREIYAIEFTEAPQPVYIVAFIKPTQPPTLGPSRRAPDRTRPPVTPTDGTSAESPRPAAAATDAVSGAAPTNPVRSTPLPTVATTRTAPSGLFRPVLPTTTALATAYPPAQSPPATVYLVRPRLQPAPDPDSYRTSSWNMHAARTAPVTSYRSANDNRRYAPPAPRRSGFGFHLGLSLPIGFSLSLGPEDDDDE